MLALPPGKVGQIVSIARRARAQNRVWAAAGQAPLGRVGAIGQPARGHGLRRNGPAGCARSRLAATDALKPRPTSAVLVEVEHCERCRGGMPGG